MPLQKFIKALSLLVTISVISASVRGQSAVQAGSEDVISGARGAYSNLARSGFRGFKATIEPNWEVILAHTATPKNLKVFRAVQFSMIADADGAVTVHYEIAESEKRRLESTMKQIHTNMQGLVGGFFNTWRAFMVSSPFDAEESQIKIENHAAGYRLSYSTQPADAVLTMTRDYVTTEWKLTAPTAIRTVKPQFQKTPEGLLLTGYDGDFQPVGPGIRTTLNFSIEYQSVSGMKLPHKVRINGTHGPEPVTAELTFTHYVLNQ